MVFIKCVICVQKKPSIGRSIHWNDRIGEICEACSKSVWECPDCSREFYVGENQGRPPRHYKEKGKNKPVCDGWKTEKRRKADEYLAILR